MNDGSVGYDHDSDGTHQQVAGCQSFFRNVDHDIFARIIYRSRVRLGKTLLSLWVTL